MEQVTIPDLTSSWLPPVGEGGFHSSSSSQLLLDDCDSLRVVQWLGGGRGYAGSEQLRVQRWLPLSAGNHARSAGAASCEVDTARSIRWMSYAGSEPASLTGDGSTSVAEGRKTSTAGEEASSGGVACRVDDSGAGPSAVEGKGRSTASRDSLGVGVCGGGNGSKGSLVSATIDWLPGTHGVLALSGGNTRPESLGWLDLEGDYGCEMREARIDEIDSTITDARANVDVDDAFGSFGVDDDARVHKRKLFGFGNAAAASQESLLPDDEVSSAANVVGGDDEGDTDLGTDVGGLSTVVEDVVESATEGISSALNPLLVLLNPWHSKEVGNKKEEEKEKERKRWMREEESGRDVDHVNVKRKERVRLISF